MFWDPLRTYLLYPPLSEAEPSYDELGNYVPLKFHVAFLAYVKGASLKPDPEINVCKSLAAEILRDGFSTSGDPLLLKQCDGEDIKSFGGALLGGGMAVG